MTSVVHFTGFIKLKEDIVIVFIAMFVLPYFIASEIANLLKRNEQKVDSQETSVNSMDPDGIIEQLDGEAARAYHLVTEKYGYVKRDELKKIWKRLQQENEWKTTEIMHRD